MNLNANSRKRESTRIILDPPTFIPGADMRSGYLNRRKAELDTLVDHARAGEWKPVIAVVNHVRGSGAMYGFKNIGDAAETLVKAVQNGDAESLELMEKYAKAVADSYV